MKLITSVKAIPMLAVALLAPLVILAQASGERRAENIDRHRERCDVRRNAHDERQARGGMFALLRQARNQVRACRRQAGLHA